MGVSFDKVSAKSGQQVPRDRPASEVAPVPPAGSKGMSLKFEIQPATNPTSEKERVARLVDPGFGRIFTDHMAIVRYNQSNGWHDARVESRANFPLDPATAALHYAQEIFEGLKAYKRADGGVNLFRPDANARRFWNSAERMAMAPLPGAVFSEAVEGLVRAQMRRQLRRGLARAGRGHRGRLRSGGFPRCGRAPLHRGTRRHERLFRVR